MNKITTLMLGCAAIAGSAAANAQDGAAPRIDRFPVITEAKGLKAPAMASDKVVNDDKPLGTKMWAVNNLAYDGNPGFVYFFEKDTYHLHKTGIIKSYEEDDERRWNMSAATYHNGKYLGYMYYRFDLGYNYVKDFVEVDLENGTWKSLRDMSEMNGDWNYMEAMTSDPKTGKLIGLGRDLNGEVSSGIFEINPETGEYSLLHDLAEYYYTIAYDRHGTLWAVRWDYNATGDITGTLLMTLDKDNNYAETNVMEMKKEGKSAILYGQSQNCLYFHPKTGELFMGATELVDPYTVKTYLCKINTETGAIENVSPYGNGDSVTGLYIPGTAPDSFDGANKVTGISSVYDENGVVTISWTNPTTTASNDELTELEAVRIYRDGEADENLVATITEGVTVGGTMSWSDTDAPTGLHEYFIVPCRKADEKGVSDSWNAFSGKDIPGAPVNITLVKKDKATLELSWEPSVHGANDGWYDKDNVTYTIMRHPDEVEVAKGISETTFTDDTLGEINSYSYTVYGVTDAGNGTEVTSERIMAGHAYNPPYETFITNEEEALQWTVVDNNGDGFKFQYSQYANGESFYDMICSAHSDDYVISPAINLVAGKSYKVKMRIYFAYPPTDYDPEFSNSLRITAGKGTTAADQTVVIYENDSFQTEIGNYYQNVEIEGILTPDSDGEWNIAYHNNTNKEDYYNVIRFYGMTLYEILDNDLTALGISGSTNPTKGVASDYTVKVRNIGGMEAGSYKVQVVRIDGDSQVVLGETAVNEPLQPEATAEIVVTATPDVEGEFEIAGKAVLEGDMDNSNDTSAPFAIEASPEGTVPFNAIANNEFEGRDARTGISHSEFHSHMQHYYHPEDFGDFITPGETVTIHRIALEYQSNDTETDTEPFELTVYLGNTDTEGVDDATKAWLPTEELTQVYYGDNLKLLAGSGTNLLRIDFDNPFVYDTNKNLVIAFVKNGENSYDFPAIWRTFNYNWDDDVYRTLRFEASTEDTPVPGESGAALPYLPYLHIAITKGDSGIQEITLGDENNNIEYFNGVLSFNGIDAASVEVYDIAGRMIAAREVAETSVNVALEDGIYVVKVTDRNGNAYTKKISAKN